jgi:hypothetical protein
LAMANWDRTLSPILEKQQNLFPLKIVSHSKRSIFENRTELVESGASERNEPNREKQATYAD